MNAQRNVPAARNGRGVTAGCAWAAALCVAVAGLPAAAMAQGSGGIVAEPPAAAAAPNEISVQGWFGLMSSDNRRIASVSYQRELLPGWWVGGSGGGGRFVRQATNTAGSSTRSGEAFVAVHTQYRWGPVRLGNGAPALSWHLGLELGGLTEPYGSSNRLAGAYGGISLPFADRFSLGADLWGGKARVRRADYPDVQHFEDSVLSLRLGLSTRF